jgi:2'-5' RNA ligase
MPRLFFAVPIEPTPELRNVARRLELLGPALRVVPRDQWHLTLKFLGEIPETQIPALKEICLEQAANSPAAALRLAGLGVFPHPARPQVVWCGLPETGPLIELAEKLEMNCEHMGIPRDRRPFHPHLTLARIRTRPPAAFQAFIEDHATVYFGEATICRLMLYQSDLKPQGAIYTPLAESLLKENRLTKSGCRNEMPAG